MSETHYSLEVIRPAFWRAFNESGEHWFSYFGTPEENSSCTEGAWDGFVEGLATAQRERLAAAIVAVEALDDIDGNLHSIVGDYNFEDEHLRAAESNVDKNYLDMPADHLVLERACLAALWPLTPSERERATEQAEEHLGAIARELFYQRYPEKRP